MPTTAISNAATGTVVAAQAGYAVRVYAFALSWSGTTNLKWQSHTTPTDLTGLFYGVVNSQVNSPSLGLNVHMGQFETLVGEALDLNNSASVAVGGYVVWEYVSKT